MKKRPAAPNRTLDRSSVSDSDVNEEIFFEISSVFSGASFLTGKEVRVKKSQLELQLSRVSGFGFRSRPIEKRSDPDGSRSVSTEKVSPVELFSINRSRNFEILK